MRVVLLHALPLTGAMWSGQLAWLPSTTLAPTLYGLGDSITDWATAVLADAGDEPLLVVGASVGGFCALEMARLSPNQVRIVVLVGSKAGVRRDDGARDHALDVLATRGFDAAWGEFWLPLFGSDTGSDIIRRAHDLGTSVLETDLIRGVRAFFDRPDLSGFARTWPGRGVASRGEHDGAPTSGTSEQVTIDAVDGSFHLVAGAGHYVSLERPAEFDSLLADIITSRMRAAERQK